MRKHKVLLALFLVATPVSADDDTADYSSCRQFTGSRCRRNQSTLLETVTGLTVENCQSMCQKVYLDQCGAFVYAYGQGLCSLYHESPLDSGGSCEKVGGPSDADVLACESPDSKCQGFRQLNCDYLGNTLENFENILDRESCQTACQLTSDCLYFLFDALTGKCSLLDSAETNCDEIEGPVQPGYSSCWIPDCAEDGDCSGSRASETMHSTKLSTLLILLLVVILI